tara:strand:- start:217 stop:759 length:543 start_codon:yes stop_codon:yes gene_type:complete
MQTTLDSFTGKPKAVRNKKGRRHPNPNGTSWCGPTALTVLTGKRYDIIEKDLLKRINKHRNKPRFDWRTGQRKHFESNQVTQIRGMHNGQMRGALKQYGYAMRSSDLHGHNQTFRQWTKSTYGKRGKKWFLVVAGNHYLVVKGNKVWDANTAKDGTPITKVRLYKRAKLQELFEIERIKK